MPQDQTVTTKTLDTFKGKGTKKRVRKFPQNEEKKLRVSRTYKVRDFKVWEKKKLEKAKDKKETKEERNSYVGNDRLVEKAREEVLASLAGKTKKQLRAEKKKAADLEKAKLAEENKVVWDHRASRLDSFITDAITQNEIVIPYDDGFSKMEAPEQFRLDCKGVSVAGSKVTKAYRESRVFKEIDGSKITGKLKERIFRDIFDNFDVYICEAPLPVLYEKSTYISESPAANHNMKDGVHLVISLDTEFQDKGDGTNHILSYQITCASHKGKLFQLLISAKGNERLRMAELTDLCAYIGGYEDKACQLNVFYMAHYVAAEWAAFADRHDFSKHLTDIRKSPVTDNMGFYFHTSNIHGGARDFRICIRDSILASPAKLSSLKKWGEILNFPKIELDDGVIENMESFREENFARYAQYAMRDTEIPFFIMHSLYKTVESYNTDGKPVKSGMTLSATAVNIATHHVGGDANIRRFYSGLEKGYKGVVEKMPARKGHDDFAALAYHGGFNNANYHGDYVTKKNERLIDSDLKSAYPLCMSLFPYLDFKRRPKMYVEGSTSQEDMITLIKDHWENNKQPIIVLCRFESVKGTYFHNYPTLPVEVEGSLHFVKKGESYCTGPEILVALEAGAKITIERMEIWQIDEEKMEEAERDLKTAKMLSSKRPTRVGMYSGIFAGFVSKRFAAEKVAKDPEKTIREQVEANVETAFMKEFANSLYGKIAQAVKDRTITGFSPYADDSEAKQLDPSKITLPVIAAMTTGTIRACVHSMNMELTKNGYTVLTSTTDGSLIAGKPINNKGLHEILKDSFCSRTFRKAQKYLGTQGENIYEIKHEGDKGTIRRTRAYTLYENETPVMIAKGGIQIKGTDEQIAAFLKKLDGEDKVVLHEERRLTSARDIAWYRQKDMVSVTSRKRTHNDYDFKRRLKANGTTAAWGSVQEYQNNRILVDRCHASGQRASFTNIQMRRAGQAIGFRAYNAFDKIIQSMCVFEFGGWNFDLETTSKTLDISKTTKNAIKKRIARSIGVMNIDDYNQEEIVELLYDSIPKLPRTQSVVNEIEALLDTMEDADGKKLTRKRKDQMIASVTENVGDNYVGNFAGQFARAPAYNNNITFKTGENGELIVKMPPKKRSNPKLGTVTGSEGAGRYMRKLATLKENLKAEKEWKNEKDEKMRQAKLAWSEAYKTACEALGITYEGNILTKVANKRKKKVFDKIVQTFINSKRSEFELQMEAP